MRLVPLLVAVLVAAALAVPIVELSVQQLGAGAGDVISSVNKAWINYVFSKTSGNKLVISGVKVKFDSDLPTGSYIRVEIRDSDDDVVASGEVTLDSDLSANTWIMIDLAPDIDGLGLQNFYRVVIVVSGQEVST